jgi:C-terminal processing protease CtpA/Prc
MKTPLHLHGIASLIALSMGVPLAAQQEAEETDQRRVRIEVLRNENGQQSQVTREFDLNDAQQLQDALRELGVLDEMNRISDGENLTIDLRRMRDGGMLNDMSMALSLADGQDAPDEPRPYLGVFYGNWNESCDKQARKKEPPVKEGAAVTAVDDGTPAEKAGFQPGDVIIDFDGTKITGGDALVDAINTHSPGDRVKITYYRGKDKRTADVTLGEREEEERGSDEMDWNAAGAGYERAMEAWADAFAQAGADRAFLGVDGEDMEDDEGVRITHVVENSAAQKMGLAEGDVIRRLNGTPIADFGSLAEEVQSQEPGEGVDVVIYRNGKEITLSGKLGKQAGGSWSRAFPAMPQMPMMPGMPDMPDMPPMPPMPELDTKDMSPEDRAQYEQDMVEYQRDLAERERDMAEQARDRAQQRREMDELREEMNRLRDELRGEVTREMRVTIEDVQLNKEETQLLKNKGVTALNSALDLSGMRLFPNPSGGSFNIAFQVPERGDLDVDVHDSTGDRVYHETISGFKGNYERVLDMSDRASGTYFVVITQNGKALARKMVKQ